MYKKYNNNYYLITIQNSTFIEIILCIIYIKLIKINVDTIIYILYNVDYRNILIIRSESVMTIKTLNYEELPIAKDKTYLDHEILDIIEDCQGINYEVRKTLNGKLVAYQIPEEDINNEKSSI